MVLGTITYGVLKVEDGNDVSQIVTTGANFANTVQPVITTNLNGQLYVIGSPNDVLVTQSGNRAIAPRATVLEGTSTVPTSIKKVTYTFLGCVYIKAKFRQGFIIRCILKKQESSYI